MIKSRSCAFQAATQWFASFQASSFVTAVSPVRASSYAVIAQFEPPLGIPLLHARAVFRLRKINNRLAVAPSIHKDGSGWPELSAVSAERVGLFFASLFSFINLAPAPNSDLFSF